MQHRVMISVTVTTLSSFAGSGDVSRLQTIPAQPVSHHKIDSFLQVHRLELIALKGSVPGFVADPAPARRIR